MTHKIFCTVLHTLNSPENVGMIVRSHVAHGGEALVFTGQQLPWAFRKRSEAFSRKLEKQVRIVHIADPDEAIGSLREQGYTIVAIEIAEQATPIDAFDFPDKTALVLGNEGEGLPESFLAQADHIVTIPQYGKVASLNVAVSASIAMFELMRGSRPGAISGDEYV